MTTDRPFAPPFSTMGFVSLVRNGAQVHEVLLPRIVGGPDSSQFTLWLLEAHTGVFRFATTATDGSGRASVEVEVSAIQPSKAKGDWFIYGQRKPSQAGDPVVYVRLCYSYKRRKGHIAYSYEPFFAWR